MRYIIEYNKLFSPKTQDIATIIPVAFVGESREI
jgi:hypothetical protein